MKNYEVKISPSVTNFEEKNIAQTIGEKEGKEEKRGKGGREKRIATLYA